MRSAGLNRDAVVRAALELADAEGFDRVSMRRVSQSLGVTPMAIYHYLPGKDALLDLVIDESLREVPAADPDGDVLAELDRCFGALYRLLVAHPGLAQAASTHPLEGPVAQRIAESVLSLLVRHGLSDAEAACLLVTVFGLALGSAMYRLSRRRDPTDESFAAKVAGSPVLVRTSELIAAAGGDDQQFREGLQRLVAGYLAAAGQPG